MFESRLVESPPTDSGIQLALYRYTDSSDVKAMCGRKPVLLLHGASASHLTFTIPQTSGGLAQYLSAHFDPWLLDWRGSGRVVEDGRNGGSLSRKPRIYNFNGAAQEDVRLAVEFIKETTRQQHVAAVGFCMGSAILAEAVALGHVNKIGLDCIVLMALGLFYETPIDGRLKSEDRVLERLVASQGATQTPVLFVDPRVAQSQSNLKTPWPTELDAMYQNWPGGLKSHTDDHDERPTPVKWNPAKHMCNRLSFMYGMPYHHGNLVPEIHGVPPDQPELPGMFGGIPLHMYIHGARNIRQGHATEYERPIRLSQEFVGDDARENFRKLKKVTLITGALNRLWHRDSIDLMYEWLTRGSSDHLQKFKKAIFPAYGHQDLLWGQDSGTQVYPTIRAGLSADESTT
jgi:pimeloyl-ACP methyl ester carboxylesterase